MSSKQPRFVAPKHLKAATAEWWRAVMAEFELQQHHVRLLVDDAFHEPTEGASVRALDGKQLDALAALKLERLNAMKEITALKCDRLDQDQLAARLGEIATRCQV